MAKVIEFDIDGYISSYGYNSRYVKSFLKEAGKDQVICHLCSLGGEFLVGVSIKDEFSKHGRQCRHVHRTRGQTYSHE